MRRGLFLLTICLGCPHFAYGAEAEEISTPEELRPFLEPDSVPLDIKAIDLNGDGRSDYLLVLQRQEEKYADADDQRPLLILLRQADNTLKLAKRNDKIIYCSRCGGVLGDPYLGMTLIKRGFIIEHAGGSAWRWSLSYQFNYSKRDKTWRLVRVEHTHFHAASPEEVETEIETPPKDFGKIDFADFNPEQYHGVGSK